MKDDFKRHFAAGTMLRMWSDGMTGCYGDARTAKLFRRVARARVKREDRREINRARAAGEIA